MSGRSPAGKQKVLPRLLLLPVLMAGCGETADSDEKSAWSDTWAEQHCLSSQQESEGAEGVDEPESARLCLDFVSLTGCELAYVSIPPPTSVGDVSGRWQCPGEFAEISFSIKLSGAVPDWEHGSYSYGIAPAFGEDEENLGLSVALIDADQNYTFVYAVGGSGGVDLTVGASADPSSDHPTELRFVAAGDFEGEGFAGEGRAELVSFR